MSVEPAHNYSGMMLDGRFIVLCPDCRKTVGSLAFQGMGLTIRACEMCGKSGRVKTADKT